MKNQLLYIPSDDYINPLEEEEDQYNLECTSIKLSRMGPEVPQVNLPLGKYTGKYPHLVIAEGLNLKAICSNQQCQGSKTRTWINLGFGKFNIAQQRYKKNCKKCGKQINGKALKTIGFTKCKIVVTGVRNEVDKEIDVNHEYTEDKGLLGTFLEKEADMCEWGWMQIQCNPL